MHTASAVTLSVCASVMTNFSRPDSGKNARILPSSHPDTMVPPLGVMPMHPHSRFGTWMRSSSWRILVFHIRMSYLLHVRNRSEQSAGKHTSLTGPEWHVPRSSMLMSSCTEYLLLWSVPAMKPLPSGEMAKDVTAPIRLALRSLTMFIAGLIMATVPSPAPTRVLVPPVSGLSTHATLRMPFPKRSLVYPLRVGRVRSGSLNDWIGSRSILNRSSSPVLVPQYA